MRIYISMFLLLLMNVHNSTNISFTQKKQHFIDKPTANGTTTIMKQLKMVITELSSTTDEVSSVVKQILLPAFWMIVLFHSIISL